MKSRLLAIAAILATTINTASAEIITFDGMAGTYMPGAFSVAPGSATYFSAGSTNISGYTFTNYGFMGIGSPTIWISDGGDSSQAAWNGTDFMTIWPGIAISRTDGGAFNLSSLDLANYYDGNGMPGPVYLFGTVSGGGYISQTLSLSTALNSMLRIGNDFGHFELNEFTNLSSVNITVGGNPTLVMDNLNVTPVPEPETYAMMLAGLGLLGVIARRRKQKG